MRSIRASRFKRMAGLSPRRRNHITASDARGQQRPPPLLEELAHEYHYLRGQGQRLARLRERRFELRHDPRQQQDHRRDGDAHQDRRVDQRRFHRVAQFLVAIHRVGEALQDHTERASRLAGADDADVEAREHFAPRVQRLRQRLASPHIVADALQELRDGGGAGQADQYLERTIERHSGMQQRREFAREREQLVARHLLRLEPHAAPRFRLARGRRPRDKRATAGRVGDLHWHQALVAQAVDDLGLVRRVEFAHGDFACRIDRTGSDRWPYAQSLGEQ
jgi:hypothetical protein